MNEAEKILWDQLHKRFDKIEEKLDNLTAWKWKITGGAALVSALVSFLGWLIK